MDKNYEAMWDAWAEGEVAAFAAAQRDARHLGVGLVKVTSEGVKHVPYIDWHADPEEDRKALERLRGTTP